MPFVSEFVSTLRESNGKKITQVLWGDTVKVLGNGPNGTKKCVVRCQEGLLPSGHIGDEELLEVYIIDVGQGDGNPVQDARRQVARHRWWQTAGRGWPQQERRQFHPVEIQSRVEDSWL